MTIELFHRATCRLCDSPKVGAVVKLQPIPLSENYKNSREEAMALPRFPIDVYMCEDCGHVQQLDVIDPSVLWKSYTYYSGDAKGMPEHFNQIADEVVRRYQPPKGSLVIDIGSNDGSLLMPFQKSGFRVLGIDPAEEVAKKANASGIPTITSLMTLDVAKKIREEHGQAHVMCAFNVFAHADDLGEMVDCVRMLLAPGGVFIFEAQYLLDIIDGVLIATIFHEHMSHHSVKPLVGFFDRHGLELISAERASIQHGSLIGSAQLKGGPRAVESSVKDMLALEADRKLGDVATMLKFGEDVAKLREKTMQWVKKWKADGSTVAGYGAARSGPTLIAQLGLAGALQYIVDDHPMKVGRRESGDGVPVVPTAELLARQPDYTVILAWVHSNKIIESNREYLDRGGHFVVLCPDLRIIGKNGEIKI